MAFLEACRSLGSFGVPGRWWRGCLPPGCALLRHRRHAHALPQWGHRAHSGASVACEESSLNADIRRRPFCNDEAYDRMASLNDDEYQTLNTNVTMRKIMLLFKVPLFAGDP